MSLGHLVATVLLVAGGAICVLACLGVAAMRNVYDRLHYVGAVSIGTLLIAVAVVVRESFSLIGDKALAVAAVLLFAGPVVAHTTARSARIRERGEWMAGIEDHRELGP
jgi:monovalent cation/proton antiporter MnhG/PhaG subunit